MSTRIFTTTALMVLTTLPLAAQRGARGADRAAWDGPDRALMGEMLERRVDDALDRRDDLALTEDQVAELEALRLDIEGRFAPLREEAEALRSEARDRSGTRDEVRERMAELRERHGALRARADTVWAPLQARFEQAVPPLQRQNLQRSRRGEFARGAAVGRRFAPDGPGARGSRGDRGFAPGARNDGRGFRRPGGGAARSDGAPRARFDRPGRGPGTLLPPALDGGIG